MQATLSELFLHLLTTKNFYARVANSIQRVEAPGYGTFGIGIRDGRVVLFYDPEFLAKISMQFGIFILEHEVLHIILDHIPRHFELLARLGNDEEQNKKAQIVANQAMDCAVNCLLRTNTHFEKAEAEFANMQRAKCSPEELALLTPAQNARFGMVLPEKYGLDKGGAFEYYSAQLMKKVTLLSPEETEDFFKRLSDQFDDHSKWMETDKDGKPKPVLSDEAQGIANQIRTQLKGILRQAVKDQLKGQGTLPQEIAETLHAYVSDPIIPWWQILTQYVQATQNTKTSRGTQRPNRTLLPLSEEDRSILPAIGKIRDPSYRVFFYVDTSGSMDSESLAIALSEISHLLKVDEDLQVRYMQGDCTTHYDKVFHHGEELPKEAHGRGGTDFNEYFRYMGRYAAHDETKPDLVIVYTDGYAPAVDVEFRLPPEIPVLWVLTRNHARDTIEGYGAIIVCDPSHNQMYNS